MPVGQDLSNVLIEIRIAILTSLVFGCRQYADIEGREAIDQVVKLLEKLKTEAVTDEEWRNANTDASAAWSESESAYDPFWTDFSKEFLTLLKKA